MIKIKNSNLIKKELKSILIDLQDEVFEKNVDNTYCIRRHLRQIKALIKTDEVAYSGFIFPDIMA